LNKKARWLLASAYQTASQPAAAQALIQGMSLDVDTVERSDNSFSSTLGDLGLRLQNLIILDKKQDANQLLEQIASQMSSDSYQNTQGIAWALMGVSRYLDGDTSSFTAKVSENGTTKEINSKKSLNSSRLVNPDSDISIENTSGVKLFANLISSGIPVAGNEISQAKGLDMTVNFGSRDTDDKDSWLNAVNNSTLKVIQGKDMGIAVTLKNTSKHKVENIALTIPTAAGLEILSASEQGDLKSKYDYRDLRDDRIHYYFGLKKGESKTFHLIANASYLGKYYQPAITAEAMYDGNIKAIQKGRWLDIVKTLGPNQTEKTQMKPKGEPAPAATAVESAIEDAASAVEASAQ